MDAEVVAAAAGELFERCRRQSRPVFLECRSERFTTHSSATRETRGREEMARIEARCPIAGLTARSLAEGDLDAGGLAALEAEVSRGTERAFAFAGASPYPQAEDLLSDVDG